MNCSSSCPYLGTTSIYSPVCMSYEISLGCDFWLLDWFFSFLGTRNTYPFLLTMTLSDWRGSFMSFCFVISFKNTFFVYLLKWFSFRTSAKADLNSFVSFPIDAFCVLYTKRSDHALLTLALWWSLSMFCDCGPTIDHSASSLKSFLSTFCRWSSSVKAWGV